MIQETYFHYCQKSRISVLPIFYLEIDMLDQWTITPGKKNLPLKSFSFRVSCINDLYPSALRQSKSWHLESFQNHFLSSTSPNIIISTNFLHLAAHRTGGKKSRLNFCRHTQQLDIQCFLMSSQRGLLLKYLVFERLTKVTSYGLFLFW